MKRMLSIILLLLLLGTMVACQSESSESSFSSKDLILFMGGQEYHTGMNIETVFANLGRDYTYSEGLSCDYDGLDKTYIYNTTEFYTFPLSEGDIVNEIYTQSPTVTTSKGLFVGSSKEEIVAAYGEGFTETDNLIIYKLEPTNTKPNGESLCFEIESDVVTAIFITTQPV